MGIDGEIKTNPKVTFFNGFYKQLQKSGPKSKTYIHRLYKDLWCCLAELPRQMVDWDRQEKKSMESVLSVCLDDDDDDDDDTLSDWKMNIIYYYYEYDYWPYLLTPNDVSVGLLQ